MPPAVTRSGFTTQFNTRSNVLGGEVGLSEAWDPKSGDPRPQITTFKAIWDTGATGSVITKKVISALGLKPIDKVLMQTANGEHLADVYLVNNYFPNNVGFSGVRVSDGQILGTDVLVGMDIIGSGDFAVTHSDGRTCMSFQIPSHRRIDFVKLINQEKGKSRLAPKAKRGRKKPRNKR